MWSVCFFLSLITFILTVLFTVYAKYDKKKFSISSINILIIGVFISSVIAFLPFYKHTFSSDGTLLKWFKTVLISIHHTIRIFIVDSDYESVKNVFGVLNGVLYNAYSGYLAVLYLIAPILSFGMVLSFFKNVAAYRRYIFCYNKDVYVFSRLNEKSISLGESISGMYKNSVIVYTGIQDQDEDNTVFINKAKKAGAICFKKDLMSVNFKIHSRDSHIKFFMISENESDNVKLALSVVENYKNRDKTWIYVVSDEFEGEVILSSIKTDKIKLRRISDVRTLVYSVLENTGHLLFEQALNVPEYENQKLISALVVGAGKYGSEMIKSLAWFGQMNGYRLEITAVDKRSDVKQRFCASCPELMDEKFNNQFYDTGEAQYRIDLNSDIDVETIDFYNFINRIKHITYIFVDVGDDEFNIRTAIKLRSYLLKNGKSPRMQVVVHNPEKTKVLKGITNHSGQSYDIDFVGDLNSLYSVGCIIDSALEEEALLRHKKWGNEADFWKYEYNHRASIASALHRRMKALCKVPGIDKNPEERTETERLNLRIMEHRRWNAYMRSEGYTYSPIRNNLAKTHNCLVTYDNLSDKEKAKDDD